MRATTVTATRRQSAVMTARAAHRRPPKPPPVTAAKRGTVTAANTTAEGRRPSGGSTSNQRYPSRMAKAATTTRTGDAYGETAERCGSADLAGGESAAADRCESADLERGESVDLERGDGEGTPEERVLCSSPPVTKVGHSTPRPGSAKTGAPDRGRIRAGGGARLGGGGARHPGLPLPPSIVTGAVRLARVKSALPSATLRARTTFPAQSPFGLRWLEHGLCVGPGTDPATASCNLRTWRPSAHG